MAARFPMFKMRSFVIALAATAALAGLSQVAHAAEGGSAGAGTSLLGILLASADVIVIVILGLASITGVAMAIDAALHIRSTKIAPEATTEHLRTLINGRQFKDLLDFTSTDQSFVSRSLNAGLKRAHLGYGAMREAMEAAAGEQTAGYFRRIELLNIIGNIGPLIGLLGTVLGMIMAFNELNAAGGNAKPGALAGGIGRALWHTFGGLFVAIPCLVMFGLYRTKTDKITTDATIVAEELLESLRPAEKGGSALSEDTRAPASRPRRAAAPQTAAEGSETAAE